MLFSAPALFTTVGMAGYAVTNIRDAFIVMATCDLARIVAGVAGIFSQSFSVTGMTPAAATAMINRKGMGLVKFCGGPGAGVMARPAICP